MALRIQPPPTTPFTALNGWLSDLYGELNRLDNLNRKLQADLEVAQTERLILHDAVGLRYVVDVDAAGPTVQATPL